MSKEAKAKVEALEEAIQWMGEEEIQAIEMKELFEGNIAT